MMRLALLPRSLALISGTYLRAPSGRLESPDWAGRMIQSAFADQNFASYFVHDFVSPGEHKSTARALNARRRAPPIVCGVGSLRGAGRRRWERNGT